MSEHERLKSFADRRAEAGAQVEDSEPDFGDEHAPSRTDPPNAGSDAPGGQNEGHEPETEA